MIIFSNDYLANLPGSEIPAKGGPANFAKRFKFFLKKENHKWIGLVFKFSFGARSTSLRRLKGGEGVVYYSLTLPAKLSRKLEVGQKTFNPEKHFSAPIKSIIRLFKKVRPDVVFLNGYALSNWFILKAAQAENLPVAIQHAGMWTKELEIYKDFYSAAGRRIMQKMEQEISHIAAAEIFLNDWSRRYYAAHVTRPIKSKTYIIPLPLDFAKYRSCPVKHKGLRAKTFHIGLIARWDRIKNHEAIARLADRASQKKLPWRFHAVTVIPDTPKKRTLKKLYRKNIEIVPPLDQAGIKRFCQKMDLLILPSYFDVSPNVVLESVACGTPIAISKNVGFVDDFQKYGAKDWIIDFSNTQSAIRQITKLAGVPLPQGLQRAIKAKHNSEKVFNAYVSLFKRIIKQTK